MTPLKNISISLKLVLLFFITSLVIILVLRFTTGSIFKKNFNENIQPHLSQYFSYINDEIGIPPDLKIAQRLSQELKIKIMIKSLDLKWSSDGKWFNLKIVKFKPHHTNQTHYESGYYKGNFVIRMSHSAVNHAPVSTIFIISPKHSPWTFLLNSLLGIFLALAILYLLLRWMISPLKQIQQSIQRIGSGELAHRIHITQSDEFGQLSIEINAMADDIEHMLEAKRQLLLAISHELRSPITRAKVALSLMDDGNLKQGLEIDLNEMEAMIKALLDAEILNSRHQVLNLASANINQIIGKAISMFYAQEKISLNLDTTISDGFLDEPRMTFVIKNLLHNALKHRKNNNDNIYIKTSQTQKEFFICVEDDGIGVSKKDLSHIMEPFYRADISRQRKTGGFGLGLYLSKMIIQAHQGQITIESIEQVGTKVTIKLPIAVH